MIKKRRPTAHDRRMGKRFQALRLRLRPDLAKHQAFGDAMDPRVTAQTVRNWEAGRPIPDKMKRSAAKLIGCAVEDFFSEVGAPLKRETEERLRALRSDAELGLTYEIANIIDEPDGAQRAEELAQKYQALGDHETADYIRSEASRMAKIDDLASWSAEKARIINAYLEGYKRATKKTRDDNGNNQVA
jgi:hypothetical protein